MRNKKLLLLFALLFGLGQTVMSQVIETFSDGVVPPEWGVESTVYSLSESGGQMLVKCTGVGGTDEYPSFHIDFDAYDMSNNTSGRIVLKSSIACTLRIDLLERLTGSVLDGNTSPITLDIPGDGYFHSYDLDFTNGFSQSYPSDETLTASNIGGLAFYVNPNAASAFTGTIAFDYLQIGDYDTGDVTFTSFTDNFDNGTVENTLDRSGSYTFTEPNGTTKIVVSGAGGTGGFANFIYNLPRLDLTNNPVVSIDVKSSIAFDLRIDLQQHQTDYTNNPITTNATPVVQTIKGDGVFHTYTFDFTGKFKQSYPDDETVNQSSIGSMLFYINPDGADFSGTIYFDNMIVGATVTKNTAPTIASIPAQSVVVGQSFSTINLKNYVSDDNTLAANIDWTYSASTGVSVSIVSGVASITFDNAAFIGTKSVTFTAIDEGGLSVSKTVSFTTTPDPSNAFLSLLSVSNGSLSPAFTQTTYSYTVTLPEETSLTPTITATSVNPNATIDITQATSPNGSGTVSVTSANAATSKTYTVTFKVPLSTNTYLSTVNTSLGVLSPNFSASNTTYLVKLPYGTSTVPNLTATTASKLASLQITKATSLNGTSTIVVTSESGSTRSYSFTYEVLSDVAYSFIDNFNDNYLFDGWDGKDKYSLNEREYNKQGAMHVVASDAGGANNFDCFAIRFPKTDISATSTVSFKVKSSDAFNLRAQLQQWDAINQTWLTTNAENIDKTISGSGSYVTLTYDFTGKFSQTYPSAATVDASAVEQLLLFVNPDGASSFSGGFYIDDLIIGDNSWTKPTTRTENFDDNNLSSGWETPNTSYSLSETNKELKVLVNKTTSSYSIFRYAFPAITSCSNPFISIDVKATNNCTLRIDPETWSVSSGAYNIANAHPITLDIVGDGKYHTYIFDYRKGMKGLSVDADCNNISELLFYVNPGSSAFDGTIYFDNLIIAPSLTNLPPLFGTMPSAEIYTYENFAPIQIDQFISDDITAVNNLQWKISSTGHVTASITSGVLQINKVNNTWYGNDTISLVAIDEAGLVNKEQIAVKIKKQAVTGINLSADTAVFVGNQIVLTANVLPLNATISDIQWTSSQPSVASVVNGTVAGLSAGQTTITATSLDGNFSKSCTVIVRQPVSGIESLPAQLAMYVDSSASLRTSVLPSNAYNKKIVWSTSNDAVASVDANGTIKAKAVGSATITASTVEGNFSTTCTVNVAQYILVSSVNVSGAPKTMYVDSTAQISVAILPSNASNPAWKFENLTPTIASISPNGVITALTEGTAKITVVSAEGKKSASISIDITTYVKVSGIESLPAQLAMYVDSSASLHTNVLPSNATKTKIVWSSSNEAVASVDANGTIKANAAGNAKITATTAEGSFISTCTVSVVQYILVNSVNISGAPKTMYIDSIAQISVAIVPSNASNAAWKFENLTPTIASISPNGVITALKEGTAKINVVSAEGKTTSVSITITAFVKVNGLTISENSKTMNVHGILILQAGIQPQNATIDSVIWTSSNPAVATVENGVVTAISAGNVSITATSFEGKYKASCTIVVNPIVNNTAPVVSTIPAVSCNATDSANVILNQYVTDDFTSSSAIQWSVSGAVNVRAKIINGTLTISPLSTTWSGTETLTLTAQDQEGVSSTTTISVSIQAVTTTENTIETSIVAFPNPCSDVLYLTNITSNTQVELFSIDGQNLAVTKTFTNNTLTLDMKQFGSGIFIISLKTDAGIKRISVSKFGN